METLDKDLSRLPERIRQAVKINVKAIENADWTSPDVETYLEYMSKKILFIEIEGGDQTCNAMITALAYDEESMKFFEGNTESLFHPVKRIFVENGWHLHYVVQIAPKEVKDHVQTIRNILYRYSDYLRKEFIAEKAQRQLEERNTLALDAIMKKSHYAQNNLLTKSGFSENLTVVQKKVLNYFILKFQHQKEKDLFGKEFFNVSKQELVNCGCGSNTNAIMKSLKDLMENTTMCIQYGNNWAMYNIFSSFQGAVDKNNIAVSFTPEMTALINKVGVSKNYTLVSFKSMSVIRKYATMRMYELCCQYRNMDADHVTISDEQLRMMLNCNDKYQNPREFKRSVIQAAEKELTQLAREGKVDLYFTFSETKKERADWTFDSKRVLEWSFVIHKAYSYREGVYIPHERKSEQVKNALKTIADILFYCEGMPEEEKKRYACFARSMKEDDLVSLVQDMQLAAVFSKDKSAIYNEFVKYGFREGENL